MSFSSLDQRIAERKAKQRLRLLDIWEGLALKAETATHARLRALYAKRYRGIVGVGPERRLELREALQRIQGITVENLLRLFEEPSTHQTSLIRSPEEHRS